MQTQTTTDAPTTGTTINITAYFLLSDAGQKAALLAGRNAARLQSISGSIAAPDLDLCTIWPDGTVHTTTTYLDDKMSGALGLTGKVTSPHYHNNYASFGLDAPPDSAADVVTAIRAHLASLKQKEQDDAAAKITELDGQIARMKADPAYVPGNTYYSYPTDHPMFAERERRKAALTLAAREDAARAFLADSKARAKINDGKRAVITGVTDDYSGLRPEDAPEGVIRAALAAAVERQRAAERAAGERAAAEAAAICAWLVKHGTEDQVERFDANVLPEDELKTALADHVFAPLAEYPRYRNITAVEVRAAADDDNDDRYCDTAAEFRTQDPGELTREQWVRLKAMRAACPEAEIKPRLHQGTLDDENVPWGVVERMGALATATATVAGIEVKRVKREYAL